MNEICDIINSQVISGNTYLLDQIYKEYGKLKFEKRKIYISESLNSKLLKVEFVDVSIRIPHYWKIVDELFLDLNSMDRKKIIDYLETISNKKITFSNYMANIIFKYSDGFSELNKIRFYERFLKENLLSEALDENIGINVFKCLWFVNNISNDKSYVYVDNLNSVRFDFTSPILFKKLLKVIADKEERWIICEFSDLIDRTSIGFLTFIIKTKKMILDSKQFKILLKFKIIQRIYVNLILNGMDSDHTLIQEILNNIDRKFKWYGSEMNDFLTRYDSKYKDEKFYFRSQIYSPIVDDFEIEKPFINVCNMKFKNTEDILCVIKKMKEDLVNPESINDINVQNEEIGKWFESLSVWNDNYAPVLLDQLIHDKELRASYEYTISKAFCYGIKNNLIRLSKVDQYYQLKLNENKSVFSYCDYNIFDQLIKNNYDDYVFNILMDYCPLELKHNIENTNQITLVAFMNSNIGYYYLTLKKISFQVLNAKKDKVIEKINLEEPNYCNYLKGTFIKIFSKNQIDFNNPNTFFGFCHSYNLGSDSKYSASFVGAVKKIIRKQYFDDEIVLRNLSIVLVQNINPLGEDFGLSVINEKFKSKILLMILNLFFKYDHKDSLKGNWILFFLDSFHCFQTFLDFIRRNITSIDITELNLLFRIFRESNKSASDKINVSFFSYIPNMNQLESSKLNLLIDFYENVIQANMIDIDYMFIDNLDRMVKKFIEYGFKEEIEQYIDFLGLYIPSSKISEIKSDLF